MTGERLRAEIHEQPAVLARLLAEGRPAVERAAELVRAFSPRWVLLVARGSSDNAARYAQYVLGAHNRLGAGLAVPSLYTLYDAPPFTPDALVIGISQSGQSPDVVAVVEEARRQGALTLAITNDLESPMARASAAVIPLLAGLERSVAATKTYTCSLLAVAMLSASLTRDAGRWAELEALPGQVEAALGTAATVEAVARRLRDAERMIVLGRGYNYATAFEASLKIKETTRVVAEPYSAADLLHGPIAMLDRWFPVIVVAPSGAASHDAAELHRTLESRGAEVFTLTDDPALAPGASAIIDLPPGVPEWLSPIVAVVPAQLLATALAVARGLDPERPDGLAKVTRTR